MVGTGVGCYFLFVSLVSLPPEYDHVHRASVSSPEVSFMFKLFLHIIIFNLNVNFFRISLRLQPSPAIKLIFFMLLSAELL